MREIEIRIVRGTAVQFNDFVNFPLALGEFGYATDTGELFIGAGLFNRNLTPGDTTHDQRKTLVHELATTLYHEVSRVDGQVVGAIYWTNPAKTQKIRQVLYTRVNGIVVQVIWSQYDAVGVLVMTLTKTITRNADGQYINSSWSLA